MVNDAPVPKSMKLTVTCQQPVYMQFKCHTLHKNENYTLNCESNYAWLKVYSLTFTQLNYYITACFSLVSLFFCLDIYNEALHFSTSESVSFISSYNMRRLKT